MIRPAMPSLDKLTPTARLKQTKAHEPSPASTLGDSATDSSNPATPQDFRIRDLTNNMNNLMAANVDDSSKSKLVYGSKCLMLDEHDSEALALKSSPPKSVKDGTTHHSISSNSSPDVHHPHKNSNSPTWRIPQSMSFVRSSGSKDDPFVASAPANQSSSKISTGTLYRVREDRAGAPPTPGTAQAHFSPDACVFVANLLQSATDQQLEHAVTTSFSLFGTVYVKIRRDPRGMPFAFAQYETEAEAQRAVTEGRNIPILGRHCRTEIAKVNRTLYLSKIAGGDISREEAQDVLKEYGAIEELHYASSTDRALYGLPQGIFVRFHFYDDCRDAQIRFRMHESYRLEQARIPEDLRSTMISRSASRRSRLFPTGEFVNLSPARYSPQTPTNIGLKCDEGSIFVGNLPPQVNEPRLHEHFATFGRILSVVICPKPFGIHSMIATAFAFVEFSTRGEAAIAVQRASRLFDGFQIRVEHKVPRRLFTNHGGSPTSINQLEKPRLPAQAQDMLMMLYNRGVEVGMNHAAQAQAIASQVMPAPIYTSYTQPYYTHYDNSLSMYAGPNGGPSTYGLGPQSYHNGNIATDLGPPDYVQTSTTTNHLQPEPGHCYTQPTSTRDDQSAYAWPLPVGENGLPGNSITH